MLRMRGCGSCAILSIRAGIESPRNGSWPVSSWKAVMASEKRSELPVTARPASCSGDMNDGVPSTTPVRVRLVVGEARDAEVGDLQLLALRVEHDVRGLDVAVDHAAAGAHSAARRRGGPRSRVLSGVGSRRDASV